MFTDQYAQSRVTGAQSRVTGAQSGVTPTLGTFLQVANGSCPSGASSISLLGGPTNPTINWFEHQSTHIVTDTSRPPTK